MNLSQAKDLLLRYMGRGSSFAPQALDALRQAALWIEQNHTLAYMKRVGEVTVRVNAERPRVIAVPTQRLKAFQFLRAEVSGSFQYILQVAPQDVASIDSGVASYFYLDGVNSIILDAIPTDDYVIELGWVEFTDWPVTATLPEGVAPWECWLLTNGEPALIAQTMLILGTTMRDPNLVQLWQPRRDEAMKSLLNTENDLATGGGDNRLAYGT